MGVTRGAALGRFRRLKGKIFPSQAAREAIKEAYEAGATVRAIAQVIGVTAARVQQITAAMGAKR